MNAKIMRKGRAVVLALLLLLILSVPVLAVAGRKAWEGAEVYETDSLGLWEQYQWVMEQMELEREAALSGDPAGKFDYRFWKPDWEPDSGEIHRQYQWVLAQEVIDRQFNHKPPPKLLKAWYPSSAEIHRQYYWAQEQAEIEMLKQMNERSGKKPLQIMLMPFDDNDVFQQYLDALEMMEKASREAVPNH